VNAASPTILLDGERLLVVGAGLFIANVSGADSPPKSGSGSKTVTENVPAVAISEAAMAVVNFVESTNVVDRSEPSMRITKPSTKSVPLTVSVNPDPPAVALDGERLLTLGAASITPEAARASDLKEWLNNLASEPDLEALLLTRALLSDTLLDL
jgi:hypothetical protein